MHVQWWQFFFFATAQIRSPRKLAVKSLQLSRHVSRCSVYAQKMTHLQLYWVCSLSVCVSFSLSLFSFKSFRFYFLIAQDTASACWMSPFLGRTVCRSSCPGGYTASINSASWYLGLERRCALIWWVEPAGGLLLWSGRGCQLKLKTLAVFQNIKRFSLGYK